MHTRRRITHLLLLSAFLALTCPAENGHATPSGASESVRVLYDSLLSTMRDGPTLGPWGRYERLKPVIGRTFDIPYMAGAVVGPIWANASSAQQQGMTDAFWRYVTATYADRFSNYSGQQLEVTGERPRAASVIVESRIVRADGTPVIIKYLMRQNGEDWRVADVYLEGTISELVVRRSEFSTILQQQGIDGLILSLNRKAEALLAEAAK